MSETTNGLVDTNNSGTANGPADSNSSNSNGGNSNRNRNNFTRNSNRRNNFSGGGVDALRTFKGAVEALPVLGTKVEKDTQDFSKFTKSLLNHVLTNFSYPQDIAIAITDLQDPIRNVTKDLPTKAKLMEENHLVLEDEKVGTTIEKAAKATRNEDLEETVDYMRKAAFSEYNKRKTAVTSNMAALWGLVMGQCTLGLQQVVKAEEGYDDNVYNPVWLLNTIKKVISGVTHQSNIYHTAFHVLKDFYRMRQKREESVDDYLRRFEANVDLVLLAHTEVFDVTGLFKVEIDQDPHFTKEDAEQRFLAMAFIENSCTIRFSGLWEELSNGVAMKLDKYPRTLSEATYLLTHYKSGAGHRRTNGGNSTNQNNQNNQFSFHQGQGFQGEPIVCQEITENKDADGIVKGTDGQARSHVQCYNCGWHGHYLTKCPAPRQNRGGMYHFYCFTFNQVHLGGLPLTVIILDTGSTFNSFFNRQLLENIQVCNGIRAYSNGGSMDYSVNGSVQILPALKAYYNEDSLANILSMAEVAKFYRVRMDSEQNNSIYVYISDTQYLEFTCLGRGLYCFDTVLKPKTITPEHTCLFSTVAANKECYSLSEVQGAENARTLQGRIGWPSDTQFASALINPGTLHNSPISRDDVIRAKDITGGMAYQLLKGKSVRRKKKLFHNVPRINISAPLLVKDRIDDIDSDFLYVQGKPFLITLTRKIIFQTLQSFNRISKRQGTKITYRRGRKDMITGINKVIKLYKDRGVNIETMHADGEFRKIENIVDVNVDCCATNEHVDRIERRIRMIKERTRCYWVDLPYKKAPRIMVDENLYDINEWINAYPSKHGISRKYSPSALIQGKGPVDVSTLRVTFGAYCEVFIGSDNTNKERTASCIALRPCN